MADLFEEHRQLIALSEELLALVRRWPPARIEEIAKLRVRLANLGVAHLRAEDELIMKPLLASGRADEIPDACAIIAEIRASNSFYADHAARWSMRAVDQDRALYAEALVRLIGHLRGITALEEALLYGPVLKLLSVDRAHQIH